MKRTVRLFDDGPLARNGLRLRRMEPTDLDRVMEVEGHAFAHPWSRELVRRELDHDWSTILLAHEDRDGGALLGFVIFWVVHDEVHVLNVAVDPPVRRRGVARTLLAELLDRARAGGCALATLEVRRSNQGAIGLYAALGFRQVGVRPKYYADENEDALIMTLEL